MFKSHEIAFFTKQERLSYEITCSDSSRVIYYYPAGESSDLQLNESLYMLSDLSRDFKYKKKGLKNFVRVKPNPTYRVSELSRVTMYSQTSLYRYFRSAKNLSVSVFSFLLIIYGADYNKIRQSEHSEMRMLMWLKVN